MIVTHVEHIFLTIYNECCSPNLYFFSVVIGNGFWSWTVPCLFFFFRFIGFFNDPQFSLVMNQVHHKSRLQCSFECLEQANCYFFDECKVGSSISCYFYDNNVANSSDDENGKCIRYALVRSSFINSPISWSKNYIDIEND